LVARSVKKSAAPVEFLEFSTGDSFLQALDEPETLQKLKQQSALVLLDINMPGLNGFEVVARIRERIEQNLLSRDVLAIIIWSSSEHEFDKASADEDDLIRDYVVKPLQRERFNSLIATYAPSAD